MNIALIFAGGTGTRMHTKTKPKQFLELNGKPIIIHTVEHFNMHTEIDTIVIVCVKEWIDYLNEQLKKFQINKVCAVVSGGKNGQQSIFFGLKYISDCISQSPESDIILIHDGVRPLISEKLISDNILCVKKNGNSISTAPVIETIIEVNEKNEITNTVDRSFCKHAKAPQCFYLKDILDAHNKAIQEEKDNIIDSATIMSMYGYKLHIVPCGSENIKITTPSDFYIFRAICEARENSQIWGI